MGKQNKLLSKALTKTAMARSSFLILVLILTTLLAACSASEQVQADPTALPYTPITIEPLEIARGDPAQGEVLFGQYCAGCHSLDETVELAAPSLFQAGKRFQFSFIKNSIVNPHEEKSSPDSLEFMPEEIGDQLEGEELYDVIAYVRTLK